MTESTAPTILERIAEELNERIAELVPAVEEHAKLTQALAALQGQQATTRATRGPGRPRKST